MITLREIDAPAAGADLVKTSKSHKKNAALICFRTKLAGINAPAATCRLGKKRLTSHVFFTIKKKTTQKSLVFVDQAFQHPGQARSSPLHRSKNKKQK